MGQSGDALEIVARVDFRTLDEFEAGFSDRLGADALFLSRHHIVTPAQDIPVGTAVRISIALPTGAEALTLDGTVAWAYPRDRVPPGREAGVGVRIDTIAATATERVTRMRKRPSAGTRVRAPGERLLARATRIPSSSKTFAGLASSLVAEPAAPAAAPPAAPAAGPAAAPAMPRAQDPLAASFDVLHPPAPAPRVMGLIVDQTFDPTPTPQPLPHFLDSSPPRPLPLRPEPPDPLPPPPLAELPDAPPQQPAGAFDQRRTDVDLLLSLQSVDVVAVDADEARAAIASEAAAHVAAEADATGAFKVEELPSAEAELVLEANPALFEETLAGEALEAEPVTAEADPLPAPSSQEWEARTEHGQSDLHSTAEAPTTSEGERSAIPRPLPRPEAWPAWPPLGSESIGVAFTVSFRRRDPVTAVESFAWPTTTTKRIGRFELAREEPEPEAITVPPRTNPALEEPTADGFERGVTDPGLSLSGVLERVERAVELAARDAEDDGVDPDGLGDILPRPARTDPSLEDPDSVFATTPAVVRPAMAVKPSDIDEAQGLADVTSDELKRPTPGARPGYVADDEDADTDLDMLRPNLAGRLSRR